MRKHIQTVVAAGLLLCKGAVQIVDAVCHVNAVGLHGERIGVRHDLDGGKQTGHRLGKSFRHAALYCVAIYNLIG